MSEIARLLSRGEWLPSFSAETFQASSPFTGAAIGDRFPVSVWDDIEPMLQAAAAADEIVQQFPAEKIAQFLESYAAAIEADGTDITTTAHLETGLPINPRLQDVELPRAFNLMRQAAECVRSGQWALPEIDTSLNIRSRFGSIGPVFVLGPNNFPLAINSIAGQDFVSAVAAGNPVIAKGHPSHPETTRKLARLAQESAEKCGFPPGYIQLIYHMSPADGLKMIADKRIAAVTFTGSRSGGLRIKAVADAHGKPVYLEMSSVNPVFVLPDYFAANSAAFLEAFAGSCLLGSGQFCTNPGLIILPPGPAATNWLEQACLKFAGTACGPLFSEPVRNGFLQNIEQLVAAGAELLIGGTAVNQPGYFTENTLLKVSAEKFLTNPLGFQQEAFGNSSLIVTTSDCSQMLAIARQLEGQLTGCVYLSESAADLAWYRQIEPVLRRKVGRLLNNKMPTGVAATAAMNHGGPYPATGHPGFTAVGVPASIRRFAMLQCYDNVPEERLPPLLQSSR